MLMRLYLFFVISLACLAAEPERIILDAASVKNLGIETVETEEGSFEQTLFALGEIEVLPGKRAVVSSRIPGRAFSVLALPHQQVEEGDELMWVESRQPGDPPPTIMLPAPMSGLVSKVDISIGQPIHPDQVLMEIVDLNTVEASAHVPQHLAGKLALGQIARIRIATQPDKVVEAKLAHLGAYADREQGTVEAAFHLPNEDLLLRPGLRAEFHIIVSKREGVTTIPRAAVQGDAASKFVLVKDYELDNAFAKVSVQLGEQNDQSVEVIKGLLPGDEVVTRGAYALSFAGKGSVSLKDAMDAAHGHPHNEDGTEMTKEQIAAAESHGDHDHDHEEGAGWSQLTTFFAGTSGFLLVLLIVSLVMSRRTATA
jgi:multidrug efflux pump subunit AcrA (membrane-fusion protein)